MNNTCRYMNSIYSKYSMYSIYIVRICILCWKRLRYQILIQTTHSKLRPIYPQIKMIKNCASKILETGVYPRYLKVINAKKSGHCLTSKGFIGPRVSVFTWTKIRLKWVHFWVQKVLLGTHITQKICSKWPWLVPEHLVA